MHLATTYYYSHLHLLGREQIIKLYHYWFLIFGLSELKPWCFIFCITRHQTWISIPFFFIYSFVINFDTYFTILPIWQTDTTIRSIKWLKQSGFIVQPTTIHLRQNFHPFKVKRMIFLKRITRLYLFYQQFNQYHLECKYLPKNHLHGRL